MPLQANQFVVPSSGTIVIAPTGNERTLVVENIGTCPVYVGPIGTSNTKGFKLVNGTNPPDRVTLQIDGADGVQVFPDGANTGSIALEIIA